MVGTVNFTPILTFPHQGGRDKMNCGNAHLLVCE